MPPWQAARRAALRCAPVAALAAALVLAHGQIWTTGAEQVVPVAPEGLEIATSRPLAVADVTYEAWLVARHAHTLLSRPWRLFDTEHCAPEQHTLVYGVPMVALGILGMPAALISREPVLVYNAALVAWNAVAAAGMYALVAAWTGRRSAAVVAALLFAFHPIRLDNVQHPAEWDIAWAAPALYFAERLFSQGRWRDAVGLGLAGAMQVATSFYTLFATSLLALPLGLWLLLRRAPRKATPAQLAVAVGCVALATAVVLGPYLAARADSKIGKRTLFAFASWQSYAPHGPLFLGWSLLAGALVGLSAPRRHALARIAGDPRPALCSGAALVALVAAGPTTAASLRSLGLPVPDFDLYALLAWAIPGLDTVRGVARLSAGVHWVACVLAGAGAAAALAAAGRHARAAGCTLVVLAGLACFGAPLPRPLRWQLESIRPSQASIDFFAALGATGSAGPLIEVPVGKLDRIARNPPRILLSAWHGRRTSACFGSYAPARYAELGERARALPRQSATDELRRQGFTTIVIHESDPLNRRLTRQRYERAIQRQGGLRLLRESDSMIAYEILPEPAPESRPGQE